MRVSFPVRQMLRLLSDSISRNVERLSYAQRLHTRKLVRLCYPLTIWFLILSAQINSIPTESHPTGYFASNVEDILSIFDADFGVLVVGEGAKILGPNSNAVRYPLPVNDETNGTLPGQEILILAEYLRLKQFETMQVSQAVTMDFPDLILPTGLEVIAGLLYVPLSANGKDFIALLRKGQLRDVQWAGRPTKVSVDLDGKNDCSLTLRKGQRNWGIRAQEVIRGKLVYALALLARKPYSFRFGRRRSLVVVAHGQINSWKRRGFLPLSTAR